MGIWYLHDYRIFYKNHVSYFQKFENREYPSFSTAGNIVLFYISMEGAQMWIYIAIPEAPILYCFVDKLELLFIIYKTDFLFTQPANNREYG